MTSPVVTRYHARARKISSLLCVGLDPERSRLGGVSPRAFNERIISATAPFAAAYKLNLAFYEAYGAAGLADLAATVAYLKELYPDVVIIGDAKRADIGSTSAAYAHALYDELGFDAVTLNPYLGRDALAPFLERTEKLNIILCRTSNPGAGEIQDQIMTTERGSRPLWLHVAEKATSEWAQQGNVGLVVGATVPEQLATVRRVVGDDVMLLIPGIGAQGGDVAATVRSGISTRNDGVMINSSRGIIFSPDPALAARQLCREIQNYLA